MIKNNGRFLVNIQIPFHNGLVGGVAGFLHADLRMDHRLGSVSSSGSERLSKTGRVSGVGPDEHMKK